MLSVMLFNLCLKQHNLTHFGRGIIFDKNFCLAMTLYLFSGAICALCLFDWLRRLRLECEASASG